MLVSSAVSQTETRNDIVDQLFREWDKPSTPGCALGVIRDGELVYERGYGMADLEHNIPLTSESVFYVASMSKQFTAASVALLAQQGKLSLDDDIRKFLPETPSYQRPVLIRNLIYHTSGIRDYIVLNYLAAVPTESISSDDENYERMALTTSEQVFKLIARQRALNFLPGDESAYSNSNYILLAQIVKRVSGKTLPEFADENIFKPLGMVHTHYYDDLFAVVKNRAIGYSPRDGGAFVPVRLNNGTVGPAGVLTSVNDLLLWDRNFYNNGLGGRKTFIDLLLTGDTLNDGTKLQYAFGLVNYKYKGLKAVGHDGGFFGFKTSMNRFPEQRFTVICLCNSRNAPMDVLADQVTDIYLANEFKNGAAAAPVSATESAITLSDRELQKFAGIYWNPITEGLWMLSVRDGKLVDPGGGGSVLIPIGPNRFRLPGQSVTLVFESVTPDARPTRLVKITKSGKPQVYNLVQPAAQSVKQLSEYAGRYRSDELDSLYTLGIQGGKLVLLRDKAKAIPFTPTFADNFWSDEFGYLRFTRDTLRKVNGFLLTGGWIRRLRFART
ncbi:MAG: serine hydrolase domain-containing protein [Pyrinomonadaceae bacterium]